MGRPAFIVALPWMTDQVLPAQAWARRRGDRRPRGAVRRRRDRVFPVQRLGGEFLPPYHAIAIANLDLAAGRFVDVDAGARRGSMTLALELKVPIGVAHDPVVRDGARLFQSKDSLEADAARDRHVKVVG